MAWWQQQQSRTWNQGTHQPRPSNAANAAPAVWPANKVTAAGKSPLPSSSSSSAPASSGVTVVCRNPKPEDAAVVRTLVGDYLEHGSNHNRKVYRKPAGKGAEGVDVFLYYWDDSDGPAFQGWWFGNQVGGSQVWSHCGGESPTPPKSGWKVPWDGKVCAEMSILPRVVAAKQKPTEGPGGGADGPSSAVAAGQQPPLNAGGGASGGAADVIELLTAAIDSVKKTQEQAKAVVGSYTDLGALNDAEEALAPKVHELTDALKKHAEGRQRATGDSIKKMAVLHGQLRTLLQSVNADMGKIRSAKSNLAQSLKDQEAEQKDLLVFEEFMPEARQRAEAAEDAVEKAVITSELISAAGDELDELKQAVEQTEEAVQDAQKVIGEARIVLNAKLATTRRFESASAKTKATEELTKLQKQLQECQTKLNPLKTVRQDYQQRAAAQKLVLEVLEKLGPAEVDVDRAEEASALLGADTSSKEAMQHAEKAITTATDHIAAALRFLEMKKKSVQNSPQGREELQKLEDRAKESQKRLQEIRAIQKEKAEQVMSESILVEAVSKVSAVSEALSAAGEAESPFLLGVEELPVEQMSSAVKACEVAIVAANTAVSSAKMFLATKIVEAKRFSKEVGDKAQVKLKEQQDQLEEFIKKFTDFKKVTADRKRDCFIREAEDEVRKSEALAKKVEELAAIFDDNEKLFAMSPIDIRKASTECLQAEAQASSALTKAKKFVTDRQVQAKSKDSTSNLSGELIKYQLRLTTASTSMAKCKKACASVDKKLEAKKVVEDANARVGKAESRMDLVEGKVKALEEVEQEQKKKPVAEKDGEAIEKMIKDIEVTLAEAQAALKNAKSYVDTHSRTSNMEKEDLTKQVQPKLEKAQERLDSLVAAIKDQIEKAKVAGIVQEAEAKVQAVDDIKEEVLKAETELIGSESKSPEEAGQALRDLEAKVHDASQLATNTKTHLAMKKLAAKRLAGPSKDSTNELLGGLQDRLEEISKAIMKAKRTVGDQKTSTVRREVNALVDDVELKVTNAEEACKLLPEITSMEPKEMKSACEKAGAAQTEAQAKVDAVKTALQERQRNAKNLGQDLNTTLLAEVGVALDKVKKFAEKLDKLREATREAEHKFVAKRLLEDCNERATALENQLAEVSQDASVFAEKIEVLVFASQAADVLRQHASASKLDVVGLLGKMSDGGTKVTVEQFVAYCTPLFEQDEFKDVFLSEEQLKSAYAYMLKDGRTELEEADLVEQLRTRYVVAAQVSMTSQLQVAGGKTMRKLETNEIVIALEEPQKEEAVGLARVHARDKDGKEGWISISGNQGTKYLQPFSSYDAYIAESEAAIQSLGTAVKDVLAYVDAKANELKGVRTGPLIETRTELMKLRPRVMKVSHAQTDLKKKAGTAQKKVSKVLEAEKEKRQEAADKKAADTITKEVDDIMKKVESDSERVLSAAEAARAALDTAEDSGQALKDAEEGLDKCRMAAKEAENVLKERIEQIKNSKGPLADVKTSLIKSKVAAGVIESKCRKEAQKVKASREELSGKARESVIEALRTQARSEGLSTEALFTKLSKGELEISLPSLREYLASASTGKLKESMLNLGLERFGGTLSKLDVAQCLEDYKRCVKEIAITTVLCVKETKTHRKLAVDELVEVLESASVDDDSKLHRVKCRALTDDISGWVTLRGNQGTPFLEATPKPYLACEDELTLQASFEGSSEDIRKTKHGEVFELLEGPRKEAAREVLRVKCRATKDQKGGYVTIKDASGAVYFEQTKRLICKQAVALTTAFDIAEGKATRKLEPGEMLEQLEAETTKDDVRSLWRAKVRSCQDSKEGWATIKGNQGTEYLQVNDKIYICTRAANLETKLSCSTASSVRALEVGELIEAIDKPVSQTLEGASRVKGRSECDGQVGWLTMTPKGLVPWQTTYTCASATALGDSMDATGCSTVRKIEPGEKVQALSAPQVDKSSELLRVRVRADKDGKVGYVTIRGNQGTWLFRSPGTKPGEDKEKSSTSTTGKKASK